MLRKELKMFYFFEKFNYQMFVAVRMHGLYCTRENIYIICLHRWKSGPIFLGERNLFSNLVS